MALIKIKDIRGKGNEGMYKERFPRIYAAGIRSKQPELRVGDCFNEYNVAEYCLTESKDRNKVSYKLKNVGAIDRRDMRNAGIFTESSELLNPPMMTKFQTIVEDLKSTVYKSYWNAEVGKKTDFSFCVPPDLDIYNTTFGRKTKALDNLYDVVMPNRSLSPETDVSKSPGYQFNRNYCKTSYNPNTINGSKSNADRTGKLMKCCLTDDSIYLGTNLKKPIFTAQYNFQKGHNAGLGSCLTPNENIRCVPKGHAFGKKEPKDNNNGHSCLTYCELNPERELFNECLAHLNTLRKCLAKRFDKPFFRNFYLQLRYLDNAMCGWLPKEVVYHFCKIKFIRFNPSFIEPLLKMWEAINGTDIKYKTFINVIDFTDPLPDLPKVCDISPECVDFTTTYTEMAMPHKPHKAGRAGIPSGRYIDRDYPVTPDGCCKADRSYLPQESDAKACLSPSIFTLLGVSHRDMYTERDPGTVKKLFQAAGEDLNDDMFTTIWDRATKYHPKGLVSFETFRRALNECV